MNVAVKPAIECPKFRAHQDEGLSYLGSLQQSVQIIHHPGEKQYSVVSAENQDTGKTGPGGLFIQLGEHKSPSVKHKYDRPSLTALISHLIINGFIR